MNYLRLWTISLAVVLATVQAGCVSPGEVDQDVITRYQQAMLARSPVAREASEGIKSLQPSGNTGPTAAVVKDAAGQSAVLITLDDVIKWTLANNPDIAVVSFDPAVSYEQMVEAAAAFDYVLFANASKTYTDQFSLAGRSSSAIPAASTANDANFGIKQTTVTGAQWSATFDVPRTYNDDYAPGFHEDWQPSLNLTVTQPLLRNAWPTFNLAQLRIARVNEKITTQAFRQTVEQSVTDAVAAYWNLHQARRNVGVQEELLKMTESTLEKVKARMAVDATIIQLSQIQSALETRRSLLVQGRKALGDAQQVLARLVGSRQVNVLSYNVVTQTLPVTAKVEINTTDQLLTALRYNPLLEQARLALQVADINVDVAKNQTLPVLNFTAGTFVQGQGNSFHSGMDDLWHSEMVGYNIGLQFEYPIGNRAAEAELRRQRLLRLKQIATIQANADTIALNVGQQIRQIASTYEQMQVQQKALEYSRTLLKALEDSEIKGRLTPEYLNVKLNAQADVAQAELLVIQATVNYNTALIQLAQQTGTVLEFNGVKMALPAIPGGLPPAKSEEATCPQRLIGQPASAPPQKTRIPLNSR
ncbi:MAG: TolC family protein [Planctomycetaceae bacterium]|nr:TolC family protein [Planctomycetaceae bacterium]